MVALRKWDCRKDYFEFNVWPSYWNSFRVSRNLISISINCLITPDGDQHSIFLFYVSTGNMSDVTIYWFIFSFLVLPPRNLRYGRLRLFLTGISLVHFPQYWLKGHWDVSEDTIKTKAKRELHLFYHVLLGVQLIPKRSYIASCRNYPVELKTVFTSKAPTATSTVRKSEIAFILLFCLSEPESVRFKQRVSTADNDGS